MKFTFTNAVIVLLGCLCPVLMSAQNFSDINKKNAFKFSGSFNLDLGYYEAFGIDPRRDRFSYLLGGNVNPQVAGIDVPLSATYSQQETTFLQPFNQVGFSPSYKWITAHGGFRSLTYSSLTLSGHTFLGGGVDLQIPEIKGPFKYTFSAMYGRFRRPIEALTAEINSVSPAYKRMGYAFKLGLQMKKKAKNKIDLILFRGYDQENSIEAPLASQNVKPEDNLVLGLNGQIGLFKSVTLKGEFATSALSRDRRVTEEGNVPHIFNITDGLIKTNATTQYKNAIKLNLNYANKKFTLGLKYNRIDPDYRTLGAYFFQNDLEDITLNGATNFFEGKANLSASIGIQRNNLEGQQNTEQNRTISSLSWNHALSDQVSYNLSYSNFSSALVVVQDILSDSLNLYQLSTNYSAGVNYGFGGDKLMHRIGLQGGHQIGNSRDEYSIAESNTKFYNAGLNYQLVFVKPGVSVQIALNFTANETAMMSTKNLGPSLSIGKKFFEDKLSARYMFSYIKAGETANVFNNRVSGSYKIGKKHKLKFSFGLMSRTDSDPDGKAFSELRGTTGYQFSF